jgi:hypothetical protein
MEAVKFKVGDRVKLTTIPPQVRQDKLQFPETFTIFQKAAGHVFHVRGFDEYGHVELWLRDWARSP